MRKQNIVTTDTFVKLRGLPYTCAVPDIERFFEGNFLKNVSRIRVKDIYNMQWFD